MTKFIGFSGRKQTGKDTSAKILNELLFLDHKNVAITSFATILKDMCVGILGLTKEGVFGTDADKNSLSHIKWDDMPQEIQRKYSNSTHSKDKYVPLPRSGNMTNREVLQIVGTDIFRKMYPNVWVDALFRRDWSQEDYVLIPDVRFPNEALAIEEHGGILIRLERNTGLQDAHISEIALDGYNFKHRIDNNGSFKDLEDKLKAILHGK
jgi:hypothetical protein